jgi:hypothetical protein
VASIEITNDALIVHVEGLDRLWALRSRLEIPLQHVLGAEVDPERATNWWQGVRIMGTALPGVIRAGTFLQHGEWVFWDVHDPALTVVIALQDEHYTQLVLQVADPPAVAAAINRAVRR